MAKKLSFTLLGWVAALVFVQISMADTDPIPGILMQFSSTSVSTRASALDQLLNLGVAAQPLSDGNLVSEKVQNILQQFPADANAIAAALIQLLSFENSNSSTNIDDFPASSDDDEDYNNYYGDLVAAVVSLHDVNSIPALVAVIQTGNMATDGLAALGTSALDPVLAVVYDPNVNRRDAAAFALKAMLTPTNLPNFSDPVSKLKILTGLTRVTNSFDSSHSYMSADAQSALIQLPKFPKGDLNADNAVDCADMLVIKAAFGKKVGQAGFDIRADINGDGVVNILDLSAEARLMPTGTTCK